ncbi:hypothetical protein LCGC14_2065690, partial [marine sediment metagenome]
YHINLTANSTDGNETHEILIFTVDVTLPSLDASTFSGNHTLHYAHENITFQFNYSDNNQLFSINISTPEGDLFNITGLNGTSYIFNGSINASTYGIGRKNITTEFCDAHTAKKIGKWKYKKRWDKKIQFDNGLLIGPESVWGWQDVEVKKLKDSYIFTYYSRTFMVGATKRFIVEGEKSVFIYGNQGDYKGWVIVDNKRWVDHNLKNQPNAEYNIIRINEKILKKYRKDIEEMPIDLQKEVYKRHYLEIARSFIRNKDLKEAIRYYKKAKIYSNISIIDYVKLIQHLLYSIKTIKKLFLSTIIWISGTFKIDKVLNLFRR